MRFPLLRSPPFPGVARTISAVSVPAARIDTAPVDPVRREAVLSAIRDARVGGTFWAPPGGAFTTVIRPGAPRDIARATEMEDDAHCLWVLPRSAWGMRSGRQLRRRGYMVAYAPLDPWMTLGRGGSLIAHGDDEWCAIALIAGAPVRLLSSGRYGRADEDAAQMRRHVGDSLIAETAYRDVFDKRPTSVEATIELLASWRAAMDANRGIAVAVGFARWKQREIKRFLYTGRERPLRFVRSADRALRIATERPTGAIAVWPSRISDDLLAGATAAGIGITRVEDGFIRSVGLGSNLVPPHSVTIDASGIHYDPAEPSDLETLLETADFPDVLLARAARLIDSVLAARLGKYGAATFGEDVPARLAGRRLVLVPGQVEDDLSVLRGGSGVVGNLDLLARARAREPDAEIWFRPHPDVDAGHRRGAIADRDALRLADRVVREGGMATLLDLVDAVHVLTSLAGFEALLRRRDVTTHGMPFYAGWGLTTDLAAPIPRRTRTLTLEELVAGALILFPRYLDPVTGLPCPVETLVSRFAGQRRPRLTPLILLRTLQGAFTRKPT